MSISNELMYAILAMDSYNRGYGAVVELAGTQVGTAVILDDTSILDTPDNSDVDKAAGFYAASYSFNGETVISFRGTNFTSTEVAKPDVANGWFTGAGDFRASQLELATQFLEVAGSGASTTTLTGHSLGGGLFESRCTNHA